MIRTWNVPVVHEDARDMMPNTVNLVRHLECFVAVAEELHFGRAAVRLHMAQPPLSQRIRGLERQLGVELFVRSSRSVQLTPAGRVLLVEAHGVLDRVERLQATMSRVRGGELGDVRVGVPSDLPGSVVARIIASLENTAPDARVELREGTSAELLSALAARHLDVGIVLHPAAGEGLAVGPSVEKPLGVWVREDSPLAAVSEVALSDLSDSALVLFPRESAPEAYDELLAACHAFGYAPDVVHHARAPSFAVGLVMSHGAVALASDPGAGGSAGVAWRPLAGRPLHSRMTVVWREGTSSAAVTAAAEETVVALQELAGWRPSAPESAPRPRVPRPASGLLG